MSTAEYAAHRGISVRAVQKALKSRIAGAKLANGKVDAGLADELWRRNTDPVHGGKRTKRIKVDEPTDLEVRELREKAVQVGVDPDDVPDITDSRALLLACQAALASIELEQKRGTVIDQDAVRKEAYKLARMTRDAMLAIPDRLAAEIAGMTDPMAVHAKLTSEIRSGLSDIIAQAGS